MPQKENSTEEAPVAVSKCQKTSQDTLTIHGVENHGSCSIVSVSGQDFVSPGEDDWLNQIGSSSKVYVSQQHKLEQLEEGV